MPGSLVDHHSAGVGTPASGGRSDPAARGGQEWRSRGRSNPVADGRRRERAFLRQPNLLLVGGGAGQFKGGRHIVYPAETRLANLHLTLMDTLGVAVEHLGDGTGTLKGLALS